MKRTNNLFEKILTDENLEKAIREVNKSHRWRHYPDKPNRTVLWIEATKADRIKELRSIIKNGFEPSPCICKKRYDSNAKKWRDINEPKLWPDQYVHHALIQVLEPVMMRGMDHWCCGSIKGRGAHYGIYAIKKWMKYDKHRTRYCLEADICHFYDSIKPEHIMARFKQLIKDYRTLDLIERIIKDGIKIGFYTSQWFANTFLQPLDHYLREVCKVDHYIRYIDNFTIFTRRKRDAKKILKAIRKWLAGNDLRLKGNYQYYPVPVIMSRNYPKKTTRLPNALGYRFGRGFTLLRKHTKLKLIRELKKFYFMFESGIRISLKLAQGLLSRLGMLKHCNSVNFTKKYVPKGTMKKLKKIIKDDQSREHKKWDEYLLQVA